jgi:hypothetical protein
MFNNNTNGHLHFFSHAEKIPDKARDSFMGFSALAICILVMSFACGCAGDVQAPNLDLSLNAPEISGKTVSLNGGVQALASPAPANSGMPAPPANSGIQVPVNGGMQAPPVNSGVQAPPVKAVTPAPIDRIQWDWGDGQTDKHHFFPASHEYTKPGSYQITVTVFDANNQSTSKTVSVEIK